MGKLFFFTDLDPLDDAVASFGQIADDAYGPLSPTQFRLNSLHKLKPTAKPTAYAVTKGAVLIHDVGDNQHVNLILKPEDQPSENDGIGVPRIKYFIYRHIKRGSLLVTGSSPLKFVPAGTIDMVDLIRDKYGDKSAPEVPVDGFLTSGAPAATIASVFAARSLPFIAAGKSIGSFDPNMFGFEILLDDVGFEPDLALAARNPDQQCIWNVPVSSISNADQFTARAQREYVLHFLDPCAFFGNTYLTGLRVKNNGNVEKIKGKKPEDRDKLYPILKKFRNHDRAYIDIRNENNHSYNYYRFVDDPAKKDLFSIYSTDLLDVTFANDAASTVPPPVDYYGSGGWPLLIVKNSDFPTGNTKEKNVVSIAMPRGNNGNATLFVAAGILNKGLIDGSLEKTTVVGEPEFRKLILQPSGTSYEPFELVIPNNATSGDTAIIPTYSRVKYLRRVAAVNFANDPAATDVQYADHLFPLLLLQDTSPVPRPTSYESEQYVDLTQADQLSESEYVGCTQIALGQNNVTFCCYPVYERGRRRRLRNPRSEPALRSATLEQYVSGFAVPFAERPPVYVIRALDLLPHHPHIIHYARPRSRFNPWLSEDDFESVVMLILARSNYDALVKIANDPSVLSPLFDVYLAIKDQSHRDRDPTNDEDNSTPPIAISRCSLVLRGFKLNGSDVQVEEVDTKVPLFAKREENGTIHTILTDRDAVLNGTSQFKPFDGAFLVKENGPTTPPTGAGRFTNIYNDDLERFIGQLYQARLAGDATSTRLYDNVFSKLVKQTPVPSGSTYTVALNFEGGQLTPIGLLDQGFLLEGANYFAVWRIAESLGRIRNDFQQENTRSDFLAGYASRVLGYAFLNNLVESLRGDGIRSPAEILAADVDDSVSVPLLRTAFVSLFQRNNQAMEIRNNLIAYYQTYDKLRGPSLAPPDLKRALDNFMAAKQQYVSDLTRLVYRKLGGTVAEADYTVINAAIGEGRDTSGQFGQTNLNIFLYNYSFDRAATRTRDQISLDDIPIPVTSDDTLAIHFGIYGIEPLRSFRHTITVRGKDRYSGFLLGPQPTASFTAKPTAIPDVGKWEDVNKDLELGKPLTHRVTSVRIDLDSRQSLVEGDEQSFFLAFYRKPAVVRLYARSFEELFADDTFVVSAAKQPLLWPADDSATLDELIKVLKKGATLELELMLAGGVGRRKTPDPLLALDPFESYSPGAIVVFDGQFYQALVAVAAGSFRPEQWLMQSMVQTDPAYVFAPVNPPKWTRAKEETGQPLPNTPEVTEYPRLRYSYASIVFAESSKTVKFRVESYASPVWSQLDDWRPAIGAGLMPNQWTCLDPKPTIIKKDPGSDANVKNSLGQVVYSDSYNLLLSALRCCGLLDALLERIKLADTTDTNLAQTIDAFKMHPSVKVTYTPFPWEDELQLSRFLQMITTGCP
jgi:hypothetical protein